MFCKIINGKLVLPPHNDGNKINVHLDPVWCESHGFTDMTVAEINAAKAEWEKKHPKIKEYSKYKIYNKLVELGMWDTIEQQLKEQGLRYHFELPEKFKENNPVFVAFLKNVPDEIKKHLDECLWNAD